MVFLVCCGFFVVVVVAFAFSSKLFQSNGGVWTHCIGKRMYIWDGVWQREWTQTPGQLYYNPMGNASTKFSQTDGALSRRPLLCISCFFPALLSSLNIWLEPAYGAQTQPFLQPPFAVKNKNNHTDTYKCQPNAFCNHIHIRTVTKQKSKQNSAIASVQAWAHT